MNLSINTTPAENDKTDGKKAGGGKFLFTRSFDSDPASLAAEAMRNAPTPMTTMTVAEFEGAKAESYAAGVRAGRAESAEDQNAMLVQTVQQVVQALQQVVASTSSKQARTAETVVQAVRVITQKALPAYFEQHGFAEIEKLVTETLQQLKGEPRLVIRVADQHLDRCITSFNGVAAQAAYEGKLVIMADNSLGHSGCRIEWADGGLERLENNLWTSLEQALNHRVGKHRPQVDNYTTAQAIPETALQTGVTHDNVE